MRISSINESPPPLLHPRIPPRPLFLTLTSPPPPERRRIPHQECKEQIPCRSRKRILEARYSRSKIIPGCALRNLLPPGTLHPSESATPSRVAYSAAEQIYGLYSVAIAPLRTRRAFRSMEMCAVIRGMNTRMIFKKLLHVYTFSLMFICATNA